MWTNNKDGNCNLKDIEQNLKEKLNEKFLYKGYSNKIEQEKLIKKYIIGFLNNFQLKDLNIYVDLNNGTININIYPK